jgi:epoxide hydrolase-like predicted phosphatase
MHKLEVVFFDWGGVLAGDPGDDFLTVLLRKAGANDRQIESIYETYMPSFMRGQISEAEYWQGLSQDYDLKIHESISEDFKAWRGLVVNQDVLQLVQRVKAAGYRTAILSNVIEPTYNVLQAAGHYSHFDEVIASCKVGYAKPQEEIYQLALERLQTSAKTSLFIDDKQKNLDPAAKLGFSTILARNPAQVIADVSRYL